MRLCELKHVPQLWEIKKIAYSNVIMSIFIVFHHFRCSLLLIQELVAVLYHTQIIVELSTSNLYLFILFFDRQQEFYCKKCSTKGAIPMLYNEGA